MLHGVGVLLLGALMGAGESAGPSAEIWKDYEARKATAGRDADGQVQLALWCEQHGLQAERLKHLALAVLRDPSNAKARGLLGLVEYRGKWQAPEAVTEKLKADAARSAIVQQYRDKRQHAGDDAEAQWKLALWCEEHDLKEESIAHLRAVVRLDPKREAAWKHLGYIKRDGRWISEAHLAEAKLDAEAQKSADHHWRPLLERYRESFESKSKARQAAAEAFFETVTDPRAVPSIWAVFASKPDAHRQAVAVRLLAQIDAAAASRCLTILAVSGASAEVRRTATETLPRRDVREFGDILVAMVQEPIKYEVNPVGEQGSSGSVSIQGKEANLKRIYTPPPVPMPVILPTDQVVFDPYGLPVVIRSGSSYRAAVHIPNQVFLNSLINGEIGPFFPSTTPNANRGSELASTINAIQGGYWNPNYNVTQSITYAIPVGRMMLETENVKVAARRQLESDVDQIRDYNQAIDAANNRVLPLLQQISGLNLGADSEAWGKWWIDQIGMRILPQKSQESATIVEQVPIDYQPAAPVIINQSVILVHRFMSCFGAGTLVRTRDGARAIEALMPGDVVLTQSTTTGALGYQPVLKVHRNPPSATFRVSTSDDDALISSPFHRFWVAGRGWVLARDLKTGDVLRTLGGLSRVTEVKDDRVQPVFNLDVATDADFFAGRAAALVHDNTLPDLRMVPFDAAAVEKR